MILVGRAAPLDVMVKYGVSHVPLLLRSFEAFDNEILRWYVVCTHH